MYVVCGRSVSTSPQELWIWLLKRLWQADILGKVRISGSLHRNAAKPNCY